ncbi:MAG: M20 family peptidase [Christensenellales bacterium]|jgi:carboxypeptidase PM20D1
MLWALLFIAVVICYMLFRAVALDTHAAPKAPVDLASIPEMPMDAERATQSLSAAIRIKTVSYKDTPQTDYASFIQYHNFLRERYPLIHSVMQREAVGGYSLLYRWRGDGAAEELPVLFMAHMDVVPVQQQTLDQWPYPPFSGEVAEGYVWGRGTMDMKSHMITLLEAAETLIAQGFSPKRDIYFAFGHDEEIFGEGIPAVQRLLQQRNIRFELVLDEGGCIIDGSDFGVQGVLATIGLCEKGIADYKLTSRQAGGHSSTPPRQTALGVIARAIDRIQNRPRRLRVTPPIRYMLTAIGPSMNFAKRFVIANLWLFGPFAARLLLGNPATAAMVRTTMAPTMAKASDASNVLPEVCEAVVNCRILPGETVESVRRHIARSIADDRVEITVPYGFDPSPISDRHQAGYARVAQTVMDVFPGVIPVPTLLTGATDSRHMHSLSDCVLRFSPCYCPADARSRIHSTGERIAVDNIDGMLRFFARLMQQF